MKTINQEEIKQTPTNSITFKKAKEQAINHIKKRAGGSIDDWYQKKINLVSDLVNYPTSSIQLRSVSASAKAIIIKAHLKEIYPNTMFKVYKTSYNSLTIEYVKGVYPYGLQQKTNQYSDRGDTDLMTDYFDVDTYLHYENAITNQQHFYKSIEEVKEDLDQRKKEKELSKTDYYDDLIKHLENLVKVDIS